MSKLKQRLSKIVARAWRTVHVNQPTGPGFPKLKRRLNSSSGGGQTSFESLVSSGRAQQSVAPSSVIAMVGMPGPGIDVIFDAMRLHGEVTGLAQPFRKAAATCNDPETALKSALAECSVLLTDRQNLLIKEAMTNLEGLESTLDLLASARSHGIYTGLIIVLQCPFEAYLFHGGARQTRGAFDIVPMLWQKRFKEFAQASYEGLGRVTHQARAQHFRIVRYAQFTREPENELARLMALIPERMQLQQRKVLLARLARFYHAAGAEVKAVHGEAMSHCNFSEHDQTLIQSVGRPAEADFMTAYRRVVSKSGAHIRDRDILDELTLLVS